MNFRYERCYLVQNDIPKHFFLFLWTLSSGCGIRDFNLPIFSAVLNICTVRSEYLLSAWRNFASLTIQNPPRKDSDQTRKCRLIYFFVGSTSLKVRFVTLWLIIIYSYFQEFACIAYNWLTHWWRETPKWVTGKQCRPRSDAAAASDQGLHCLQIVKPFFFMNVYIIIIVWQT